VLKFSLYLSKYSNDYSTQKILVSGRRAQYTVDLRFEWIHLLVIGELIGIYSSCNNSSFFVLGAMLTDAAIINTHMLGSLPEKKRKGDQILKLYSGSKV